MDRATTVKVLELYGGIGGVAEALAEHPYQVSAAVDIDRTALSVYAANHFHRTITAEIATLDLAPFADHFWWLSPPCRPFTRRGRGRDLHDSRSQSLLTLIDRLPKHLPPGLGIENVPPFAESATANHLRQKLRECGYRWREALVCPTELSVPMRRRRFYLLAVHSSPAANGGIELPWIDDGVATSPTAVVRPLSEYLEPYSQPPKLVPPSWLDRYQRAIDVVDAGDPDAVAACFTSAYGRSPVRSGSYLRQAGQVRFFRPREIARLMGFNDRFVLPADTRTAYRLLGNSLAVSVVRQLFRPPAA